VICDVDHDGEEKSAVIRCLKYEIRAALNYGDKTLQCQTDRRCLREGTMKVRIPTLLDRRVLVPARCLLHRHPERSELTTASENVDGKVCAYTCTMAKCWLEPLDGRAQEELTISPSRVPVNSI
jgi:hypothetical protein